MSQDPLVLVAAELERRADVSEFIAGAEDIRRAHGDHRGRRGVLASDHLWVRVFVDQRSGRGEATVTLRGRTRAELRAELDTAARRAAASLGPVWRLPPAAAAARVAVADDAVAGREEEAVAGILRTLAGELGKESPARAVAETTRMRCLTSVGFDDEVRATRVSAEARVAAHARSEPLRIFARRLADLDAVHAVDRARRAANEPAPEATPAGEYDLVIRNLALGPDPARSIIAPLVDLVDAERYRLGLVGARLGQPVAGKQLSLLSDGTIPFGWRSRPFARDATATRRWSLIDRGTLAGLALDARSAALLDREPNGGVANLVLDVPRATAQDVSRPSGRPVLIVETSAWAATAPGTGSLGLGIARGHVIGEDGRARAVAGGVARTLGPGTDLFAGPVGSVDEASGGWLRGPALLRLGRVRVG